MKLKIRRPLPEGKLSELSKELGTMLNAGVPLVRALLIFSQEEQNGAAVRRILGKVYGSVCSGSSLWQAMEEQAPAFPPVMVQCVRAAEQSGSLGQTFLELSQDYWQEHELKSQLRTALLYPKLLLVLLAGMLWLMVYIILPQFQPLFAYLEELPWPTRVLYAFVDLVRHWWQVFLTVGLALILLERTAGRRGAVKLQRDRLRLSFPVVGPLRRMLCTARFARTLSSLYEAGIPLPKALVIAGGASGNAWMEKQVRQAAVSVEQGWSLGQALAGKKGLMKKLIFIAQAGEEAGQLGTMLRAASRSMEYDARQSLRRLAALAEPAMILVMALLTCFVMAAVLMPVYASYDGIGRLIY